MITTQEPSTAEALAFAEVRGVTPEFAPFIERVLWGTEGAQYTLHDYQTTLEHLPNPLFITMRRQAKLIGLRMILEKTATTWRGPAHCFYHSLFSIDPAEKGKGFGTQLAREMLNRIEPAVGTDGFIYSHVETDNHRSARVHQGLGYQKIGDFHAMSFSRLSPKPCPKIARLQPSQRDELLSLLARQYHGYALTDFPLSLSVDDYYVLLDGQTIVAGIQVLAQRWQIRHLAGFGGTVALKALPHVPWIRQLFNPKDFRFLKVGNLFFREGEAKALFELLEGVLAMTNYKTSMLFLDQQSLMFQDLRRNGRFGLLNALTQTPVQIFGHFKGWSDSDIAEFARRPKVISPVDI